MAPDDATRDTIMVSRLPRFDAGTDAGFEAGLGAEQRSRRANRRRLIVFLSVFGAVVLVGLIWDFSRPAIYTSSARLDFVPAAEAAAAPDDVKANGKPYALRDEIQYLTSTTLLAKVWDDIRARPSAPALSRASNAGDPAATLQAMLTVAQVPGTNIVSIDARGGDPAFLSLFVDRLVDDYRASLEQRFRGGSTTTLDEARDEAQRLTTRIVDQRREVDAFRAKNNIVSLERDENQVLSEVKGTGTALNTANEKVAAAQARLNALRDAQTAGKSLTRTKDNPTLAALEQQAIGIRADLRATARQFTPEYMNIDPRIRAEKAQLADIEEQLVAVRKDSAQGAVQEAQEELASARGAVATLRSQLATHQDSVQSFTSHFNEYRNLQDQLTHLETLRQKAVDRLSLLEAGERGRKPKVEVVEPASLPQSPSSPAYTRDAALVLFSALLAGLATMGIVELFNRAPRPAATVVIPQTWAPVGMAHATPVALPPSMRHEALPDVESGAASSASPSPSWLPPPLPRELTDPEIAALLDAADPEFRAILVLLLTGLTPAEVVALRDPDVDRADSSVRVGGDAARVVPVPARTLAWIAPSLDASGRTPEMPVFATADRRPLTEATIATALLYAAHDAGIDAADAVTPQTLRHTYIAFLVRQGMRFLELARLVGALPSERLSAYKRLAPVDASDPVERVLPAVRDAAA